MFKSVGMDQGGQRPGQRPESNKGVKTEEKVEMFLRNQPYPSIKVSRYFWMCGVDLAAFMSSL